VAALVAGTGARSAPRSSPVGATAVAPSAPEAGVNTAPVASQAPPTGSGGDAGARDGDAVGADQDAGAGGAGAEDGASIEALPSEEEIARCVERQLPEGSFRRPVDLAWLCGTTDPREGSTRLRSAVVAAGAKGAPTPAMRIWSRLGPYGMAAFTVVRAACCAQAAPLELPASGRCEPLAPILADLGRATAAGDSIEPVLARYRSDLICQIAQGHRGELELKGPPRTLHAAAFRSLVEARRVP